MGRRHIFVRDLRLEASIGILEHERKAPQILVVSITLEVEDTPLGAGGLDDVVDYRTPADLARAILAEGHIDLVEIYADRLATACLGEPGVRNVKVRVEKPAAIPDAAGAGVELYRESDDLAGNLRRTT
jgi:dihydroneopterin aldolase